MPKNKKIAPSPKTEGMRELNSFQIGGFNVETSRNDADEIVAAIGDLQGVLRDARIVPVAGDPSPAQLETMWQAAVNLHRG